MQKKDHATGELHVQQVTGSSLQAKRDKKYTYMTTFAAVLLSIGVIGAFVLGSNAIIEYGNEFLATEEVAEDVAAVEEEGFTFAFGTNPSDDTDFSSYTIPEPSPETTQAFYKALDTSPAFDGIASVEEIIPYDQIDKNGTISQSAMEEIIAIAEGNE